MITREMNGIIERELQILIGMQKRGMMEIIRKEVKIILAMQEGGMTESIGREVQVMITILKGAMVEIIEREVQMMIAMGKGGMTGIVGRETWTVTGETQGMSQVRGKEVQTLIALKAGGKSENMVIGIKTGGTMIMIEGAEVTGDETLNGVWL